MVQWLGLCASTTAGEGLIPYLGTKILHAALRGQKIMIDNKKNNCTKSMGRYYRGCGISTGLWETRWSSEMQTQGQEGGIRLKEEGDSYE